jgi:hypothetical protein
MRVLFVFCEGTHDVGFVRRLLVKTGLFQRHDQPIDAYPSPLDNFLRKRLGERPVGERMVHELQQGAEPPILAFVARPKKEAADLLLLYRLQGEQQDVAAQRLLDLWKEAMRLSRFKTTEPGVEEPKVTVEGWGVAFLIDADSKGVDGKLDRIRRKYGPVLGDLSALAHGHYCRAGSGKDPAVGFFALRAEGADQGTLEDMIVRLLHTSGSGALLEAADEFLTKNAPAGCELLKGKNPVSLAAKRQKAALTCIGQFDDPGSNCAVFVEHSPRLDNTQLAIEPSCKSLLDFLVQGLTS